ncbi:MAG TPA: hypothetical protein VGP04_06695, partial [Pseudonocardiaceae bacterium]|nr:hypothetical protein [Pseudonocardiaceae bacterium]
PTTVSRWQPGRRHINHPSRGKRGRCTRRLTLYDNALAGGSDGTASTYRVAIIRLRHDDTQ